MWGPIPSTCFFQEHADLPPASWAAEKEEAGVGGRRGVWGDHWDIPASMSYTWDCWFLVHLVRLELLLPFLR